MKIVILIILSLLGLGIFVMVMLSIISSFSSSKWFCDTFGWHRAPIHQGFDGCSINGTCPRCGKEVMQDSQGNWF
jgi:hypothetical protein